MRGALAVIPIAAFLLAGCTGGSPTDTPTPAPTPTQTPTLIASSELTPSPTFPTLEPGATEGSREPAAATITPATTSATSVIISLVSAVAQVAPGQQISVDVSLDPRGRGISGVEMNVEFDPASFEVLKVEPGPLLGDKPSEVSAVLPRVEIDNTLGVLRYYDARIGNTVPPTPPSIVARIKLRVLEKPPADTLPYLRITAVKVPDEKIQEISDVTIGGELRFQISR